MLAFWTVTEWRDSFSATLQAFREGCYEKTWCLDAAGNRWPIDEASLVTPASFLDKLLPWRQIQVALTLGTPTPAKLADTIDAVCEVLDHPESDFPFLLGAAPITVKARLRSARSIPELISIALAYMRNAA